MIVTEVRIKLVGSGGNDHLLCFASVTFDNAFVVRDLKLIEGNDGKFAAMPSRKLTDHCPRCRRKNPLDQRYCGGCCKLLGEDRAPMDESGRRKIHADVAHPVNCECREMIEAAMIRAYFEEIDRSRQDGYVCSYDSAYTDVLVMPAELLEEVEVRCTA